MKFQTLGDKPEFLDVNIRNDESSAALTQGKVACYKLDGTEDGLGVALPSTIADEALSTLFFAGIVTDLSIPAGRIGQVRKYGLINAIITRATRSLTSGGASWSTVTTLAKGQFLGIDTVNNNLQTIASAFSLTYAATDSGAVTYPLTMPFAWLAETVATISASATTTTDSRTVLTALAKVFVRRL